MKRSAKNLFLPICCLSAIFFCTPQASVAQNLPADEQTMRNAMREDGLSSEVIDRLIAERKNENESAMINSKITPIPMAVCSAMGFENGWGPWLTATGSHVYSGPVNFPSSLSAPSSPHFAITTGPGIDPCTPGTAPGAPPLPVVCPFPGFGNSSFLMGEPGVNGAKAEKGEFQLTVSAQDTNFLYAYAIVLENPLNNPHKNNSTTYAEIYILDQNKNVVPCSYHRYTGDSTAVNAVPPGFYAAACAGPAGNGNDVIYKPWAIDGINLAKYVGQTLTVVLINVDCSKGGHFCHTYWDFQCSPISGTATPFCAGQQSTLKHCRKFEKTR